METLTVKLETINDKVRFNASSRDNPELVIDYFPPIGDGKGYTSLELLLASFGSCVGSTLVTLLRYRLKKSVSGILIEAKGTAREEHPKSLERILLSLKIKAADLEEKEVREMLRVLEDSICPVWAMIKGNVIVDVEIGICEITA